MVAPSFQFARPRRSPRAAAAPAATTAVAPATRIAAHAPVQQLLRVVVAPHDRHWAARRRHRPARVLNRACARPTVPRDDPQLLARRPRPLSPTDRGIGRTSPETSRFFMRFQITTPRFRSRSSTSRTVLGDQPAGKSCCGRGHRPVAFSVFAMRVSPGPVDPPIEDAPHDRQPRRRR